MSKSLVLMIVVCALTATACAQEELACAYLTDQAQVCRPVSEAQAYSCDERALLYGDEGYVALMSLSGDSHDTIDEWFVICEMLGVDWRYPDECLNGPTWSVNLFLLDGNSDSYYAFYGWRVIARFDAEGIAYTTEHVTFWGIWTNAESDTMRNYLASYAESIELL